MIDAALLNPKPASAEFPLEHFVTMNILMWNCRGALNPDFTHRIFEMAVNHNPAIMVITETRVGGDRAAKIIAGLPFDGLVMLVGCGCCGKKRKLILGFLQLRSRKYMLR